MHLKTCSYTFFAIYYNILTTATTVEVSMQKTYAHIEVPLKAYAQGSIQAAVVDFEQKASVKGLNCRDCGDNNLAARDMHHPPMFLAINAAPISPGDFHVHSSFATVDNDIVLLEHAYDVRVVIYYGSNHFATLILTGEGGSCNYSFTFSNGILICFFRSLSRR